MPQEGEEAVEGALLQKATRQEPVGAAGVLEEPLWVQALY